MKRTDFPMETLSRFEMSQLSKAELGQVWGGYLYQIEYEFDDHGVTWSRVYTYDTNWSIQQQLEKMDRDFVEAYDMYVNNYSLIA